MKIINVRNGFACNSSSTHSIVFTKGVYSDHMVDSSEFGWEGFIAASEDAKRNWLSLTLFSSLISDLEIDRTNARIIAESMVGPVPSDGYVDHQSLVCLPKTWSGIGIDFDFFREFRDWVLRDDAVIIGGNDNDDTSFSLPHSHDSMYRSILPVDVSPEEGKGIICRRDPSGYWTIFNRSNGNKIRVSFADKDLGVEALRAFSPELVDLKITDYCPFGCEYCYQGSTTRGRHARYSDISALVSDMARSKVFEVAIGGGEPSLHPEIGLICEQMRQEGIVPNMTTRDPLWWKRNPSLLSLVGAVAVSCDNRKDVRAVHEAIDGASPSERKVLKNKTVVQHVLGLLNERETGDLISECGKAHLGCVLLGYKTTHRGSSVSPHVPESGTWGKWIASLLKDRRALVPHMPEYIGVDTVLAKEIGDSVPSYLITRKEGQFSCYIDAVGEYPKMYASSFGDADGIPFRNGRDGLSFEQAWRKIHAYEPSSAYVYKHKLPVMQ